MGEIMMSKGPKVQGSKGPTVQRSKGPIGSLILAGVLLCGAGAIGLAQNALAQFKVTEAEARDTILSELNGGVGGHSNREAVEMARKAYLAIPMSARGSATTALYAWTKTYVNSPSFKAAYAAYRKENTPVLHEFSGTVDEEVKRKIAEDKAKLDKDIKDMLAAGMKAQADALRQQGKMLDDKMYLQSIRMNIEETRAREKKNDETAMALFNERLPPNVMDSIALHLRAFLAATPDVDFAATQRKVLGGSGDEVLVFANDAYNKKPWQWKLAFEFGQQATAAARTAAAAWLKETGK
jgi:hypothetical protein